MTTPPSHRIAPPAALSRLLVALIGLLAVLAYPSWSAAQDDDGADAQAPITWGIRPSSATGPDGRNAFEYALDPGDTIEDYVGVSNFGDEPLGLAVYASDAFNTLGGDFDLLPAIDAPVDVGAWIAFAEPVVTVPARSRLDIPFRLTIPANATPGDHAGGIVASLTLPETSPDDSRVAVDRRVGARIYLRVSGDLAPSATIDDLDVTYDHNRNPVGRGTATVTYTITNTGNVRLTGTPTIKIAGPFGLGRRTIPGDPVAEILPGNHLTFRTTVDRVAPLARLTTTVTLDADTVGVDDAPSVPAATGTRKGWAMPWTQLGVLVLLVAVAVVWRRRRRQRKRDLEAKLAAARAAGRNEALLSATDAAATNGADPAEQPSPELADEGR
ncbi:MAG TPA: DUF916 domain-containing protein [Ilumatobacter sp.]|nr:DUF916 domain-containing protein [Ilumatobacter sp.]